MPATKLIFGYIGDSITYGFLVATAPPASHVAAMNAGGIYCSGNNQGANGTTSADWASGGALLTTAISNFNSAGVKVVWIMLGANDSRVSVATSANQYSTNISGTISALLAGVTGILGVFVSYTPYIVPGSGSGDFNAASDTLIQAYQAKLDALVNNSTIFAGDKLAYSYFQSNQSLLRDGVHPTQAGANYLGGTLWKDAFLASSFDKSAFMALAATTQVEIEATGSDTANAGLFDGGQTAGMPTDGAATAANTASPVFTSASYNFVAGDVGAWIFIGAGTNWTNGWYKIASVAANAATLSAAVATCPGWNGSFVSGANTAAGCASVASPTGATWAIDYSQQAAAQIAYTDLATGGTGLTVSSAGNPFAKQHVGNGLVITGGTNFNAGRYVIASVSAGVATVVGPTNITTGIGVTGTGGLGGCLLSPGLAASVAVGSNKMWLKSGAYSMTSASSNASAGKISAAADVHLEGYATTRGDRGAAPLIQASGIANITMVTAGGSTSVFANVVIDGANLTGIQGFGASGNYWTADQLVIKNCKGQGLNAASGNLYRSEITGCSGAFTRPVSLAFGCMFGCYIHDNTCQDGPQVGVAVNCIIANNNGSSTGGITVQGFNQSYSNCVLYNNKSDGINGGSGAGYDASAINCVSMLNTGYGFNGLKELINCATYNNTSGRVTVNINDVNPILLSGDPFVNAAAGNFAPNPATAAGQQLLAKGWPAGTFTGTTSSSYPDVGAIQTSGNAAGTGTTATQLTITSDGSTPVQNAAVFITSDSSGLVPITGVLYSDASGHVTFNLQSGATVYVTATLNVAGKITKIADAVAVVV